MQRQLTLDIPLDHDGLDIGSIRALSVRQPYAWAIVAGLKLVENRTWRTRCGPLVVHASRSRGAMKYAAMPHAPPPADELAYGAAIGIVDVVDCVSIDELRASPELVEHYGLDLRDACGPYCLILANARAFEQPLPAVGRAKFFYLR